MLNALLKALQASCTFTVWEVSVFNDQRNPPHLRGHCQTLITIGVAQAECRKGTCTHRDTQTHADRRTVSEANTTSTEANTSISKEANIAMITENTGMFPT
jgi:hypothetical protein